ncbi:Flp family type IVb pilin [Halodesulfovibrio marinisediminis]|uniref:Flp pilus assembly protein, pilin Flp n=1 Tax=Halodesulfovibrio marinisediminis DSM 17456 TaxID=1121457 RepID=A0A1N6EAI2_9BACT|nr:Flp family type IVb pilin [Halodesulfovibrio marinisediminis]SIN80055.1 Flp pilus assembly protein, pilin Flp [Halodesulfovibrio marinisediminis DSM 17456]
MIKSIEQFFRDERAASAIEYVLLASLIAAVIVATVTLVGLKVEQNFQVIDDVYPDE